jgi:hypothetical protein
MHTKKDITHDAFRKLTLPEILRQEDGAGEFMITVGDMDNFSAVKKAVQDVMGESYPWYPAVGNHDLPDTGNDGAKHNGKRLKALRTYNQKHLKNIINWGPDALSELAGYDEKGARDTNYSFDYENTHFVIIDQYYGNTYPRRGQGKIFDSLYDWLKKDLQQTDKKHILVFGHEPAFPAHDIDFVKHQKRGTLEGGNPAQRDKFWKLLKDNGVKAYFCGHVHIHKIDDHEGVKQVLVGLSKLVAWNTFVKVYVHGDKITIQPYRHDHAKGEYIKKEATVIQPES